MIAAALLLLATVTPDTTLRLPKGGTVGIDAGFRNVTVTVGSGDQVIVTGADVELEGNRITVDAGGFPILDGRRGREVVHVTVPAWAAVEVDMVSGTLDVLRAPESLIADVVNGTITTRGGTGIMQLASVAGGITVRDFAGTQLTVEAMTGPVTIEGATGRIQVETVNDPLLLRNVRSDAVHAASVNGRVEWSGNFTAGGRYNFETHNGPIVMVVPVSVSVRMHVSTFMGDFDSSIPVSVNGNPNGVQGRPGRPREREFTATYGSGAAEVHVESFQGTVRVRQLGGS